MRSLALVSFILIISACNNEAPRNSGVPDASSIADGGQAIFRQQCSTCHMLDNDAAGPKLRGALARWNNDTAKLKSFIRNAPALIDQGDPLALQAQQRAHGAVMPAFPHLSDAELNQLIAYIQNGR